MSPLKWLNEEVDDATTSEAHCKRIVIGVSESDDATWLLTTENCERLCDDSTFDTTPADRADDFAIFVHGHCSASATRAGTLDVNNTGESNALACCAPAVDVVKKITHG
jgi:hypothetical protein